MAVGATAFTENVGQWDSRAKYLARTNGVNMWVTSKDVVYEYHARDRKGSRKGQVIEMSFVGGRTPATVAQNRLGGGASYYNGKRKSSGVAHRYTEVWQKGVYQGVDARYYVDGGKPRYDLVLAPHTNPDTIRLGFKGANSIAIKNGHIDLGTQIGPLRNAQPVAYQEVNGHRQIVAANYVRHANGIGIDLGKFDPSKKLVIDPLVYGSYYGGESGNDEVRNVVSDLDGGVYLVGYTEAPDFPALNGPIFNLVGGKDIFVAKLQGDAYSNIFATYYGGSQDDFAQYCSLDAGGNLWVAGRTFSTDMPGNTRDNIQILSGDSQATGGTFQIWYGNSRNAVTLPFNATTTQVANALNVLTGNHVVNVTSIPTGGQLPRAKYRIVLDGDAAPDPAGVTNEGGASFGMAPLLQATRTDPETTITNDRSAPTSGTWTITYTPDGTNPTAATTGPIRWNATATQVQTALNALTNLNNGTFRVTGGPISGDTSARPPIAPNTPFHVTFTPNMGVPGGANLSINSSALGPKPTFTLTKSSDIFVMEWKKSDAQALTPDEDHVLIFGGDGSEALSGFAVLQNEDLTASDPVTFALTGDSTAAINEIVGHSGNSFIARYTANGTAVPTKTLAKWLEGTSTLQSGGLAMDTDGNMYTAGTVLAGINDNNPTGSGVFPVTPGIFQNGNLLRGIDVYVRKYSPTGTILISGLLGGNGTDICGGVDIYPTGEVFNSGSAITVDSQDNIYVTGVAGSQNFPRTRGVFGEVFGPNANVFVTKIAADGASLVYSTNLKTTGFVQPAGIGVDPAGNAFVTGNVHPNWVNFPETTGGQPGDPEEPTATQFGTIQVTGNALDPTYDSPSPSDFPTVEGFVTVLNPTATDLLYSSYAGGFLDDMLYTPYVDRFGDVWINGFTDSNRAYARVSSSGTPTIHQDLNKSLPNALISPLAFKSTPAAGGGTDMPLLYGGYGDQFGNTFAPTTITATYTRDGFIAKLRVGGVANIQSITLNPNTVPGGLGAQTTGTVTLSSPAPGGGADVQLDIDNTNAASFAADGTPSVSTIVVTIPAGATSQTFTVFTKPVTTNTGVLIKATYLGSFQIAQLNVVPWLSSIAVTPNTIVGGNVTSGRVTLAATAPEGGIPVTFSTDKPGLFDLPDSVTVPAGQNSVTFSIQTHGVAVKTIGNVTASIAGANKSAAVTLTTANLLSLSFDPTTVAALGQVTGTLKLDGEAGSDFPVTLTASVPAGFTFSLDPTAVGTPSPVTFTVPAKATSLTFYVNTPATSTSTINQVVTATRAAQGGYLSGTAVGSFSVTPASIKVNGLSIAPTSVVGGTDATGTVTLAQPAPIGGVKVFLKGSTDDVTFSDPNATDTSALVTFITVPAGQSSANFTIHTKVRGSDVVETVYAYRTSTFSAATAVSATLTIKTIGFTLTLSHSSVVGGQGTGVDGLPITGTITLDKPVSAGTTITVLLSSNNPAVTVPTSVTLNPGETTKSFPITTTSVNVDTPVTITATLGSNTQTASLNVRAIGVLSISLNKSTVRGGPATGQVTLTITLNAPAPAAGVKVSLSDSAKAFSDLPSSVTVTGTTRSIVITTKRVSRNVSTTITASAGGSIATTTLLITPAL